MCASPFRCPPPTPSSFPSKTPASPFYNTQTATLKINDNAPGSPQTVNLRALVIDPVAHLSTGNLTFGIVKVGESGAAQPVTLTNIGSTALTNIGIAVAGADPNDFSQTTNCAASLGVKASCTIEVTFKPNARALRSGKLVITDNAQNGPQSVSLLGTTD
jgi:hypothetical protein